MINIETIFDAPNVKDRIDGAYRREIFRATLQNTELVSDTARKRLMHDFTDIIIDDGGFTPESQALLLEASTQTIDQLRQLIGEHVGVAVLAEANR
jgi:hypothetical protein